MHRLIVLCLLCMFGIFSAQAQDQPLLDARALEKLAAASDVYIADIGAMAQSPAAIPPGRLHPNKSSFHKQLTQDDRAQLFALLGQSRRLSGAPDPETCKFLPGYRLDFVDHNENIIRTVLLCFNCNIWALGSERPKERKAVLAYGTAQDQRQALLDLSGRYFNIPLKK